MMIAYTLQTNHVGLIEAEVITIRVWGFLCKRLMGSRPLYRYSNQA